MQTSSEITKVRFHTSPILCGRIETRSISFFLFFVLLLFGEVREPQTNKQAQTLCLGLSNESALDDFQRGEQAAELQF